MDNICEKYHSSLKDGAVEKALSRLSYTIRLAEDKSKELEENFQENYDPESKADDTYDVITKDLLQVVKVKRFQ